MIEIYINLEIIVGKNEKVLITGIFGQMELFS